MKTIIVPMSELSSDDIELIQPYVSSKDVRLVMLAKDGENMPISLYSEISAMKFLPEVFPMSDTDSDMALAFIYGFFAGKATDDVCIVTKSDSFQRVMHDFYFKESKSISMYVSRDISSAIKAFPRKRISKSNTKTTRKKRNSSEGAQIDKAVEENKEKISENSVSKRMPDNATKTDNETTTSFEALLKKLDNNDGILMKNKEIIRSVISTTVGGGFAMDLPLKIKTDEEIGSEIFSLIESSFDKLKKAL